MNSNDCVATHYYVRGERENITRLVAPRVWGSFFSLQSTRVDSPRGSWKMRGADTRVYMS